MTSDAGDKPAIPARALVVPSGLVPERAGTVAFVGNQERRGDWLLPRLFRVVSVLGSVTVDLTRARVGAGTSRIEVRAVFGNIEIIVPPELRVQLDVSPVLGNFEADTKAQLVLSPDAPLIHISGIAFLANVEVKVVDPNAPTWFDRLTARFNR